MAQIRMIAVERIHKYEPGQEFDVPDAQARVLELLKKAKRLDASQSQPQPRQAEQPRRGPGRPPKAHPQPGPVGAMTRADAATSRPSELKPAE